MVGCQVMIGPDRVLGVLTAFISVNGESKREFSRVHKALLQLIASQIGTSIDGCKVQRPMVA